jgi:hypothetical protein
VNARGRAFQLPSWTKYVVAVLGVLATIGGVIQLVQFLLSLSPNEVGNVLAATVEVLRLLSGPVALILVILLWRQKPAGGWTGPGDPPASYAVWPEWQGVGQTEHWDGIRKQARTAHDFLMKTVANPAVKTDDLRAAREAVDSLEVQASGYADLWERDSPYDPQLQKKYDRSARYSFDGPSWAQPLDRRIRYIGWYLSTHDPYGPNDPFDQGSGTWRTWVQDH